MFLCPSTSPSDNAVNIAALRAFQMACAQISPGLEVEESTARLHARRVTLKEVIAGAWEAQISCMGFLRTWNTRDRKARAMQTGHYPRTSYSRNRPCSGGWRLRCAWNIDFGRVLGWWNGAAVGR